MINQIMATSSATISATSESIINATNSAQIITGLPALDQFITNNPQMATFIFLTLGIWALTWKGLALWKAAQLKQKYWFIAILVLNTYGLFEILYIYYFSKQDWCKLTDKLNLLKKKN